MSDLGTILMSLIAMVGIGCIVGLLLLLIRTVLSDEALKEASLLDQLQEKDKRIAELERRVGVLSDQGCEECDTTIGNNVFTDGPDKGQFRTYWICGECDSKNRSGK